MNKESIILQQSEWYIMEKLWEESPRTIVQLYHALEVEPGWSKSTVNTLLGRMVDKGIISAEKARSHPKKNMILRALGAEEGVECDVFTYKLARGEQLLLCSDGLTNMLTDDEILSAAQTNKTPETFCKNLIELALEAGANDNVTVVALSR